MARRLSVIIIISATFLFVIGVQSTIAVVNVYDKNGQFVGELMGPANGMTEFDTWTIYNPTVNSMFLVNTWISFISTPGNAEEFCPYFDSTEGCEPGGSGQPYIGWRWEGWLVRCGQRYFRSIATELDSGAKPVQLQTDGTCKSITPSTLGLLKAEEILPEDLPWDPTPQPPFRIEYAPSGGNVILPTVQEVPAPAITPHGIILLAGLLGGVGYLAIRRRK